jgi:uncharacterized membrane protein
MVDWLINLGISKEIIIVIVSALPILELRGALPLAINIFNMPWQSAFILAVIGNMAPVPLLLLFFNYLLKLLRMIPIGAKIANWILQHTRKNSRIVEKYELIGLIIYISVPLPFTGAWTGSIIAFLCGIRFVHALLAILCGVLVAAAIVTCLCLIGWIGAIIAGVILLTIIIAGWYRM